MGKFGSKSKQQKTHVLFINNELCVTGVIWTVRNGPLEWLKVGMEDLKGGK